MFNSLENLKLDEKLSVFVSYSHEDAHWLERLSKHLRPLERDYKLDKWDDNRITTGNRWREDIRQAIERCNAAILIISADFLASEFIHHNEIPPLLKAAEEEGALILPIIAGPCLFNKRTELSQFQAANPPSKPLIAMNKYEQEETFLKVAERLFILISEFNEPSDAPDRIPAKLSEDFLDSDTSQKLVKIGDWIHDQEQHELIGSGVRSYLLSRRAFNVSYTIECSLAFSNFGSNFNAGIVLGWKEKGDGYRYYNVKISGVDVQLERIGFNSGHEGDFEHVSKPIPYPIKSGEIQKFQVIVGEDQLVIVGNGRELLAMDRPTGLSGRVGLRPWRSQIVCKSFVATD